ncbi:hypothetical protein N44_00583 [Microcystis aeruginosa NIES-44]|uniref:Uncharacterized protein n=1 Tax=Microcystis aeruginosa NIES-44 TaxID=449439 RepID=A0A0A1VNU0_MICAE|nr:hypothetical protein N44_00583 [Microcystis aeruginosa NIES-44]
MAIAKILNRSLLLPRINDPSRKWKWVLGVSPDEKIFTPTDERGFLPYTPHPTPYTLFQVSEQ